jgi:hypothetical protein
VRNDEEYVIRYAFRVPGSASPDDVELFWNEADSLLPDTYIRRFFKIKKNGEIIARDSRANNKIIYLYCVDLPNFIRSEIGTTVNLTSESDHTLDRRITYFDHNGNIRDVELSNGDVLHLDNGIGHYIDVYDDYCSTIDTTRVISGRNDRNSWKYENDGTWSCQLVGSRLSDTLLVVEKRRGYIRYEGEIQNNYKVGEWRYYNKDGTLAQIEHYTLRDREDVRFPHRYFNKRRFRR